MNKSLQLSLVLFLSLLGFVANGQKEQTAKEYNDAIIEVQHAYVEKVDEFLKSGKHGTDIDFDEIEANRKELIEWVSSEITALDTIDGFDGDPALRDAAIHLLYFYHRTLVHDFEKLIQYKRKEEAEDSEEHRAKIKEEVEKILKKEEEHDAKFEAAQEAFAKKHGLTFKDNKKRN